jgi:hypothetical protein
MLFSRAVLWEEAGPGLRVGMDLDVVLRCQLRMDSVPGNDSLHGGHAFLDYARIFDIERNPEAEHFSPVLGDAAVAQIEAEEIAVRGGEMIEPVPV